MNLSDFGSEPRTLSIRCDKCHYKEMIPRSKVMSWECSYCKRPMIQTTGKYVKFSDKVCDGKSNEQL